MNFAAMSEYGTSRKTSTTRSHTKPRSCRRREPGTNGVDRHGHRLEAQRRTSLDAVIFTIVTLTVSARQDLGDDDVDSEAQDADQSDRGQ